MTKEDIILINSLRVIAIKRCSIIEDAEDVMQDVFLRILLRDDFENMTVNEKTAFAIRLIVNRCTDFFRVKKHWGVIVEPDVASVKVRPDVYSKLAMKEMMKKAQKRKVNCNIFFAVESGYKNIEIAEMTGKKLNTILARCRYARMYLRK